MYPKLKQRLIAFFLPQYHPIPENDAWWGNGFTEWTNVAKAKPLFKGHDQPHIPADLGFYDLRVPETRQAQADMAKEYGIEGFCYWHYWFAGKRLLERPFNEVLQSGQPDFPFCLAWANESWSGIWHGSPGEILLEQTYPGIEDYEKHFYSILPALQDSRYIKIDGKPVFVIYKPEKLPDFNLFADLFNELSIQNDLPGIFLMGLKRKGWEDNNYALDGLIVDNFSFHLDHFYTVKRSFIDLSKKKIKKLLPKLYNKHKKRKPKIFSYKKILNLGLTPLKEEPVEFPCVYPNWDNTPRSGHEGSVIVDSSPELFGKQLKQAMGQINGRPIDKQIIFIKSWNEWAEGNYLEPDHRYGKRYLKAIQEVIHD
jgi:hypothetical protein